MTNLQQLKRRIVHTAQRLVVNPVGRRSPMTMLETTGRKSGEPRRTAIGGVKQKLLAAQRAGLSTVFIPQRNEPDLDDVPGEVLEALDVKPMTDVAEIVAQALEPASQAVTAAA